MGTLQGPRFNHTLNDTTGNHVLHVLAGGSPLVSSNPFCPIIGFMIYRDNGFGVMEVGAESNPPEAKLVQ
jgi:hypothetical protein